MPTLRAIAACFATIVAAACPQGAGRDGARRAEAVHRSAEAVPSTAEPARDAGDARADRAEPEPADAGDASADGAADGGADGGAGEALTLPPEAVLADWSDRRVTVFVGGQRRASYPAIFGKAGIGKEVRGDNKTPGGTYRLHAGRPSRYARFLPVGFPNAVDGRRGFEAGLITEGQLRSIERAVEKGRLPPQHTRLGGQVGIHGFGKGLGELADLFRKSSWEPEGTRGCIMILDEHVDEVEELVDPGVTLVIRR